MATNLYETDFVAWTKEQAAELRRLRDARINTRLDLELLAEAVEDLGSERKFAFESHIEVIIEHLLKLAHSPAVDPRKKWMISVQSAPVGRATIDGDAAPGGRRQSRAAFSGRTRGCGVCDEGLWRERGHRVGVDGKPLLPRRHPRPRFLAAGARGTALTPAPRTHSAVEDFARPNDSAILPR